MIRAMELRITEDGSAFRKTVPNVSPVLAASCDERALQNPFDRHKGSCVSPAVNLGVSVRVRNHAAAGVPAGRQVRPIFPPYIPVEREDAGGQRIFVLIHKYEELGSRSAGQFTSCQKS